MALYPASSEVITVPSIRSKITSTENDVRHKIMSFIISNQKPYTPENQEEQDILLSLEARNILHAAQNIEAIYPISAHATNKKVTLLNSKRHGYALCAVDAIGCYWTFNEPVYIEGQCELTCEPLMVYVNDHEIRVDGCTTENDIRILTHNLNHSHSWSSCCCNIMHFFKNQAALEAWCAKHICSCANYYSLTLLEAAQLAKNIFNETL